MKFNELDINEKIILAVNDMGFKETSPIQQQGIPVILEGNDMIGQAQTGTGKTAAYGIPALQMVDPEIKKPQVLILCPTRELAIQVAGEIRNLAKYMHDVKVLPVYGGQDMSTQVRAIKAGVQIIVGTPGRVMDHMRRKVIKLGQVGMVILDEADEMLNMGFREDIETVLEKIPEERQLVLFSATMSKAIQQIAEQYQQDAVHIVIKKKELTVENISQYYCEVKDRDKAEVLARFLEKYQPGLSVVFCNTKRRVDELVEDLRRRGCQVQGLHGDLKQSQRDKVMRAFREGTTKILIATDVAARGIDVDDVEMIFNYDLPQDEEYYVHRIGRTGRAGRKGTSFSFVSRKDMYQLRSIERYCKTKIDKTTIPNLNEVKEGRISRVFHQISETLETEDLTRIHELLEKRVEEGTMSLMDIATVLLSKSLEEGVEVGIQEVSEKVNFEREGKDRGRNRNDSYEERKPRKNRKNEKGMTRLFINIGKKKHIGVKDIVGAIAGECGIPGKSIGAIDIYEEFSFADIPDNDVKTVLKKMKNAKIKGKKVNIEVAR